MLIVIPYFDHTPKCIILRIGTSVVDIGFGCLADSRIISITDHSCILRIYPELVNIGCSRTDRLIEQPDFLAL